MDAMFLINFLQIEVLITINRTNTYKKGHNEHLI